MRKAVSAFLAIIVLVLSCIPCSDVDAMPATKGTEATVKAAPAKDNCGHAGELCSPFCTCSCCAGFALPRFEPVRVKPLIPAASKLYAAYLPQLFVEVSLPIWQPPRLG